MKCNHCNAELPFASDILARMVSCPFCSAPFNSSDISAELPKNVEECLKLMVKKHGEQIFAEENISLLYSELNEWPASLNVDRDRLMMFCIRNVPSKIYSSRSLSDDERNKVFEGCRSDLVDVVGMKEEVVNPFLKILAASMNIDSSKLDSSNTFIDSRDGCVYKTCKIGDQVWMAENLKFDAGSGCEVLLGDFAYFDQCGYFYTIEAAKRAVPKGWRLPTRDDFERLSKNVRSICKCGNIFPHLASKEWLGPLKILIDNQITDSRLKELYLKCLEHDESAIAERNENWWGCELNFQNVCDTRCGDWITKAVNSHMDNSSYEAPIDDFGFSAVGVGNEDGEIGLKAEFIMIDKTRSQGWSTFCFDENRYELQNFWNSGRFSVRLIKDDQPVDSQNKK